MSKLFGFLFKSVINALYQIFGYEIGSLFAGYIQGAILGGLSLAIFPNHLIPTFEMRIINLFITPLLIGGLLNFSSNIKFYKKILTFDTVNFLSGHGFALALFSMRFFFAN
jgi:hypothetical protein